MTLKNPLSKRIMGLNFSVIDLANRPLRKGKKFMPSENNQPPAEKIMAAEEVLSSAFDTKVSLSRPEIAGGGTGRARVFRLHVSADGDKAPETVILKYANINKDNPWKPDEPGGRAETLFNEWASLQLLEDVTRGVSPAPRFYGGARTEGLIVMEDMGKGESTLDALLSDNPGRAEDMLIAWARAVGEMHALTVGQEEKFRRYRNALGPTWKRESKTSQKRRLSQKFDQACDAIGVKPRRGYKGEIERVAEVIALPGLFAAFSPGDTCLDNCMKVGSKLRLLDFEFGGFRHALLDAAYLRILLPTCWGVNQIPKDVMRRAEAAYRGELVKGCPEAKDEATFTHALVEACAFWLIETFAAWFMPRILKEDWRWGIASVRQRVLVRFNCFAEAAAEFAHLEAIGATIRELETKLRQLWSGIEEMPYYPAFRVLETTDF
jgi:hypothetical protein